MHVWRITSKNFVEKALTGEGASRNGGRWNHRGHPVVYTSETVSLCVLENLTQVRPDELTSAFVVIKISMPDDSPVEDFPHIEALDKYFLPTHSTLSRDFGTQWLTEKRSLILRAPSAAMQHENNYMLNTRHPLFSTVEIETVLPLNIDPRVYRNTR